MPSATSFSNAKGWFSPTLFQKNLTRFWPLWVFYGGVQFFLLTAELFAMSDRTVDLPGHISSAFHTATWSGIPTGLIFGCLFAMALFSYLMNPRSVSMFHALPIRREGLLITCYLSALAFFLLPNLVVGTLALVAEARLGVFCHLGVTQWLVTQMFLGMFFFSFAVCCAMFTGHILALPAFYGILNFLAFGLAGMLDFSMNFLLLGYSTRSALMETVAVRWLTPSLHLGRLLSGSGSEGCRMQFDNYLGAICYCLVGIVLFFCIALLTYQQRQLERAGDVVTVGWARPVFQWGVTFCTGLAGGLFLCANFFYQATPVFFIALTTLCALIGAFTARALLKKSLRVLAQGWKSILLPTLVLPLLLGGAYADFSGYQRWTPAAEDVVGVDVYGLHSTPYDDARYFSQYLTDPGQIQAVVDFHKTLMDNFGRLQEAKYGGQPSFTADENGYETSNAVGLTLFYTLSDGSTVGRRYDCIPITTEDLADPNSYAAQLEALVNRPELIEAAYLPTASVEDSSDIRRITAVTAQIGWEAKEEALLSYEDANRLWDAALEDIRAGRIHRYLLDDKERNKNCYYTDLEFTLNYQFRYNDEGNSWISQSSTVTLTPQKSATSLMTALEELGLLDQLQARDSEKYPSTQTAGEAAAANPY